MDELENTLSSTFESENVYDDILENSVDLNDST